MRQVNGGDEGEGAKDGGGAGGDGAEQDRDAEADSVSRGDGVGIGVTLERVVAKRQRIEKEVMKVKAAVIKNGGGVGLGHTGRAEESSA